MCNMFELYDVVKCLRYFDGIACSQSYMYSDETKSWRPWWKNKTPGIAISKTLNFKMPLDASVLKNLFLWYKFQSCPLFIICLLFETFWRLWATTNSSLFGWLLTGGSTVEPTCEQLNGKNKGSQVSILNHTLKY